ncbi:MAG: Zn-dependent alcohol dehydrogenase [Candidatus Rokubacteria bacterium]|nr:Zn-dependent alcohol dehydrogenase [Candidatus Rokubacteria bacterium]
METRAAVLHAVGKPLVVERVGLAPLAPRDVLLRVRASGLCHTDLEVMRGSLRLPVPIVLGHEGAGVVEAVGSAVTAVRPGDHVVASWSPNCGHCYYCDLDQPILCEAVAAAVRTGGLPDGGSRLSLGGTRLHHFSVVSSHAEHCTVPEAGAVPVPAELPFDRACLLGCAVTTGICAAVRCARVEPGSSVVVVGTGAVGLNVLQGARLAGARTIVAVDVSDRHLALAPEFGATHVVDARRQEVASAVQALTAGRGADYAFEAAGNEAALQATLDAARPGAIVVILGKTAVEARLSLRFGSLMGEKRIVRSSYGGARPRVDFPRIARAYLDGRVRLDELITRRLPLSEINEGFEGMERGEVTRAVLVL